MRTLAAALIALVFASAPASAADPKCGTFEARAVPPPLELAPPAGFIEVCGKDPALCAKVAAGYPPEARLVGYFVMPAEWSEHQAGKRTEFSRYLVAQIVPGMEPLHFPRLREFARAQRGTAAAGTKRAPVFDASGRSIIPVFEDADDAVASGMMLKRKADATAPIEIVLASVNIAYLTKDRVLSLYTYANVSADPSSAPVEKLAREWLACLRSAHASRAK